MERQVRAEVMEARQLAAAMQASREQAGVGNQVWGATEGDDDIDEQFRELCDAAGVAPERTCTGRHPSNHAQWRRQFSSASAGGRGSQ